MGLAGCGGLWEHSRILKYQRQQLGKFCWVMFVLVEKAAVSWVQLLMVWEVGFEVSVSEPCPSVAAVT